MGDEALRVLLLNLLSIDEEFIRQHYPSSYDPSGLSKAAKTLSRLILDFPGSPLSQYTFDVLFPNFDPRVYVKKFPHISEEIGEAESDEEFDRLVRSFLIQKGISRDMFLDSNDTCNKKVGSAMDIDTDVPALNQGGQGGSADELGNIKT